MSDEQELVRLTHSLNRYMAERQLAQRRARCVEGRYRPRLARNRSIHDRAIVREPIAGSHAEIWMTYTPGREEFLRIRQELHEEFSEITRNTLDPDALNGYVAFPKRRAPRLPPDGGNLVQFIPVHGGVTYAEKDSFAAVWGFDTMHTRSDSEPRTDQDWIRASCLVLYRGLVLAEKLWPEYERASQKRRAELAQQLLDLIAEQPLHDKLGFNALINVMFGEI